MVVRVALDNDSWFADVQMHRRQYIEETVRSSFVCLFEWNLYDLPFESKQQ